MTCKPISVQVTQASLCMLSTFTFPTYKQCNISFQLSYDHFNIVALVSASETIESGGTNTTTIAASVVVLALVASIAAVLAFVFIR